jgi:hypothetical protein
MPRSHSTRVVAVLLVLGLVTAACSDDGSTGSGADASTSTSMAATTTTPPPTTPPPTTTRFESPVAAATLTGPITGGNGRAVLGPPGFDLGRVGYVESELFVSGTAVGYTSDAPLTSDGRWTVRTAGSAPYTTRIVVRRPVDASRFNGSVVVEWLNVTGGIDASPDWTYAHVELIRSGFAWVGVSAQRVGIEGGGIALAAANVLKTADPQRYGSLSHPGDDYSYDLFSQVGAALRRDPAKALGGLTPRHVWAIGESQSAIRLTTYANAIAPTAKVYDGFFLHSRFASGAPLRTDPAGPVTSPPIVQIRTDLTVPVLVFSTETDVAGERGYRRAAQPDTDRFRSWEVAGTAHADAYNLGIGDTDDGSGAGDAALFAAMRAPSPSVYGGIINCNSPINTGPHTYVLRSAVAAFDRWVRTGQAPPSMPRLEMDGTALLVDDLGAARGGIRTPQVDVAVAALSGLGQTGNAFCGLFGTTRPLDGGELTARHGDRATFLSRWRAATDAAVRSGAVLAADAARIVAVAEASDVLRP